MNNLTGILLSNLVKLHRHGNATKLPVGIVVTVVAAQEYSARSELNEQRVGTTKNLRQISIQVYHEKPGHLCTD